MANACSEGVDIGFATLGYAKVAVLGVVQGITELLPISSTAHMRIVPALLGWQDPGSAFSAAMQLAALAAVVSYFWSDVTGLVGGTVTALRTGNYASPTWRLAIGIVLATIPIVIGGLLLSPLLNRCDSPLRGIVVIGLSMVALAVLLGVAERVAKHRRTVEEMRLRDALIVGIAQVGALIPGISRSGSTLTAALFRDLKREEAARFSFLIGIPAIALAGVHEIWVLHKTHIPSEAWHVLLFGLVIASLSAFAAIWGLMRFLERFSTWPFVFYRAAVGILLLAGAAAGWLG